VGRGSDKVEKVYVFGGYPREKVGNLRLFHFRSADKVYKTRAFLQKTTSHSQEVTARPDGRPLGRELGAERQPKFFTEGREGRKGCKLPFFANFAPFS
jgi:hypothetical protein